MKGTATMLVGTPDILLIIHLWQIISHLFRDSSLRERLKLGHYKKLVLQGLLHWLTGYMGRDRKLAKSINKFSLVFSLCNVGETGVTRRVAPQTYWNLRKTIPLAVLWLQKSFAYFSRHHSSSYMNDKICPRGLFSGETRCTSARLGSIYTLAWWS